MIHIFYHNKKLGNQTKNRMYVCVCSVTRSCLTLCDPMDCSPPASSVHEILQARILEWVAISSSRRSSRPRDRTCVSCIGRWVLYHWATLEAPLYKSLMGKYYFLNHKNTQIKIILFVSDEKNWETGEFSLSELWLSEAGIRSAGMGEGWVGSSISSKTSTEK